TVTSIVEPTRVSSTGSKALDPKAAFNTAANTPMKIGEMRLMTSSLSVDFVKVYTGSEVLWERKTLSEWPPFARRQPLGDRASWRCAGAEAGSAGRSGSSGRR